MLPTGTVLLSISPHFLNLAYTCQSPSVRSYAYLFCLACTANSEYAAHIEYNILKRSRICQYKLRFTFSLTYFEKDYAFQIRTLVDSISSVLDTETLAVRVTSAPTQRNASKQGNVRRKLRPDYLLAFVHHRDLNHRLQRFLSICLHDLHGRCHSCRPRPPPLPAVHGQQQQPCAPSLPRPRSQTAPCVYKIHPWLPLIGN
jgi:hypothetical protein